MKHTTSGIAFSLIIALLSAYAASWGRFYLELLYQEEITSLEAQEYKTTCESVGISDQRCIFAYSFPRQKLSSVTDGYINFGIIVPSYKLSCDGSGTMLKVSEGVVGNRNSIVQFESKTVQCKDSIDISIWGGTYYRLSGVVSGKIFAASKKFSAAYSNLSEFFYSEFRLILLLLFAFAFAISVISKRLKLSRLCASFPDFYLVPWAFFLLTSSNTLSILCGGLIPEGDYMRINSLLSTVANLGPAVYVTINRIYRSKVTLILSVIVTLTLPLAVPDWLKVYPLLGISFAILSTFISFQMRDFLAASYFLTLFTTFLKLEGGMGINPTYLPHIHFSAVHLGCVYLFSGMRRVVLLVQIFRLNLLTGESPKEVSSDEYIEGRLRDIIEATSFNEQALSLYFADTDRVRTYKLNDSNLSVSESALSNSGAETVRSFSLFGSSQSGAIEVESNLSYASIVIRVPSRFAVLYQARLSGAGRDANTKADLMLTLNAVAEYLVRITAKYDAARKLEVNEVKKYISSMIRQAKTVSDLFAISVDFLAKEGLRGFVGEVSRATNRLDVICSFNYSEEINKFLRRLQFKIEDDGKTNAPIPLAISRRESVTIENISLIKSHLSPYSLEFVTQSGAQSLIVIPRDYVDSDPSNSRTFVFYCDSLRVACFDSFLTSKMDFFFSCFVTALVRMSRAESSESALNILSDTVPEDVLKKIKLGNQVREERDGFLFCIDIIGSTALYKSLGEESWTNLVNKLGSIVGSVAGKFSGANYDLLIWDAFFVSLADLTGNEALPSNAIRLSSEMFAELESYLQDQRKNDRRFEKVAFRVCLTYGDITSDFSKGVNKTWTIVGAAMARLCKFESSVKHLGPGIYIDPETEDKFRNIDTVYFDNGVGRVSNNAIMKGAA